MVLTKSEGAQVILDRLGLTPPKDKEHVSISQLLTLPTLPQASGRKKTSKPIIDYSKSIILQLDEYMAQILEEEGSMKGEVQGRRRKRACSEERKQRS